MWHVNRWCADNRIMAVTYTSKGDSFTAGKPILWSNTQVQDIERFGHWNLDLEPGGKRFVIVPQADAAASPQSSLHVSFLLNFFTEIERRIPAVK